MKQPVVDYVSSPERMRRSRWLAVRRIAACGMLVAGIVGLGVQGCSSEARVDAVTGSMWSRTTGPLGIPLGTRVERSPLERRLRRMGVSWVANWRLISDVHRGLFDNSRACGVAPEIFMLRGVMAEFAEKATDEEIREFVRVMQVGTAAEKDAAVEAAMIKAFPVMGG